MKFKTQLWIGRIGLCIYIVFASYAIVISWNYTKHNHSYCNESDQQYIEYWKVLSGYGLYCLDHVNDPCHADANTILTDSHNVYNEISVDCRGELENTKD